MRPAKALNEFMSFSVEIKPNAAIEEVCQQFINNSNTYVISS